METCLSSQWTFFHKYLLTGLSFAAMVLFVLAAFLRPSRTPFLAVLHQARYPLLLGCVLIAIMLCWLCVPLKKVERDGNVLRISNYIDTIEVPLHQVKQVSGSLLLNPELVWVSFSEPTKFGERIVFMGGYRLLGGLSRHPVVEELRQAVSQTEAVPYR